MIIKQGINYLKELFLFICLLLLIPYELIFSIIQKVPFLQFILNDDAYDIEPQPFRTIANYQFEIFNKLKPNIFFYILLILFILFLNHKINKNLENFNNKNLILIFQNYFFYFLISYSLYVNIAYYCNFNADIKITSECETGDYFIYFSVIIITVYYIFLNKNFLTSNDISSKIIFFVIGIFGLLNLRGVDGYLKSYPAIYVSYQSYLNIEVIIIFMLLTFSLKLNKNINKLIFISLSSLLYFHNMQVTLLIIVIYLFIKNKFKNFYIRNLEIIFIFLLLIGTSFSNLVYLQDQDTLDLINEFYSIIKSSSIFNYFPQYHFLIPIILKPILLSFNNVVFEFSLLMSFITLISFLLFLFLFNQINKNKFFLSSVYFLSFTVFITTTGNRLKPSISDLQSGEFISSFHYFQNYPLKLIFYSIFSFWFYKSLFSPKNLIYKFIIYCLLIVALLDNIFIGYVLIVSFLATQFTSEYSSNKLKDFLKDYIILISFSIIYLVNFAGKYFMQNLFVYFDKEFTDTISLNFDYFGLHILVLIFNFYILVVAKNKYFETKNLNFKFLIFNNFVVFLYFIYFLGRSHPYNLYFVLYPFSVVVSISFLLFEFETNLKSFLIAFLLSAGIYQIHLAPNLIDYYKVIQNDDIQILRYADFEQNGFQNFIYVNLKLENDVTETLEIENTIFLSKYGSIIAFYNKLEGYSPFINPVIHSNFQCSKIFDILINEDYGYVYIENTPFVYEYKVFNSCFQEKLLPYIENPKNYVLIFSNNKYQIYKNLLGKN